MSVVLVTGGAGYIGSHVVRRLREGGREVVVLDDLSTGHRAAVGDTPLVQGDHGDEAILDDLLSGGQVRFIMHFAASSLVGESVGNPSLYYRNNLVRGLALLDAARRHDIRGFIFSSSAAVYGDPVDVPVVVRNRTVNEIIAERYERDGQAKVAETYFTAADHTHTTRAGAMVNAECVVAGLRKLTASDLRDFLVTPAPATS